MNAVREGGVARVGGSAGAGWAIVFVRAGRAVRVHDAAPRLRQAVFPAAAPGAAGQGGPAPYNAPAGGGSGEGV